MQNQAGKKSTIFGSSSKNSRLVELDISYQPDKQALQVTVEKTPDTLKNISFDVRDIGQEPPKKNPFSK